MTKKAMRNSSVELLRIISIFAIVLCHFATHGGFAFPLESITVPRLWWNLIRFGGNLGVDVFVFISGYFLIANNDVKFNTKKTLTLWGQVFFYSLLLFALSLVAGDGFSLKSFMIACFPITSSTWWFASTYFVLFLLHPYLNRALHSLDKKQYQKLLLLLTVCWCLIPTFTGEAFGSNQLLEFVYLYSIAGYIKLYGLCDKLRSRHWFSLFGLIALLTYLSCIVFLVLGTKTPFFSHYSLHFYGRTKLPTLLSAICLFAGFVQMKPFYSKWVNLIASATFGVYLLHDSPILRKIFWLDLFQNSSFQNSNWIIPYSIVVCIVVYLLCTAVDLVRQHLVERPLTNCFLSKQK